MKSYKEKEKKSTYLHWKKQTDAIKIATKYMKPAEIFVSRLDVDTTLNDSKFYALSQFSSATDVVCEKLRTRYDTYASFKIT